MAPTTIDAKSIAEDKTNFECCKSKKVSCAVCVKCGKAFHFSCAVRDWSKNFVILDKNRGACVEHGITSLEELDVAESW